ncbi:hypothetical protein PSH58_21845 [Pseudomonas hefeiensis]|uniref:Uncharacterized protein n=1 Tax=Pseudomonas hefeiensis TaxID=2738125 RepID=A0ABY9GIX5_9PSED|nr:MULTISPECIES: hypothetical protein [unclassified Pseudomonas]WLH15539.1 hypothetical protein PSH57_21815 [Pseudomonas sp. FP205]WLH98579.1 hypothetical protein PSH58_21845 [Pseudomonas sp. FP53]WLI42843.1 hypothetical protein PSH74_21800 [Pseudomonas sp. FP821]
MTVYLPPLTIGGQVYDFAHLEPFTFTVQSDLAGRDLGVHVTFSSHMFFEIRRAAKDKPQDLNLVVESAYHQTDKPPRLLGRMGFILLCGKIHMRQPTSTKR